MIRKLLLGCIALLLSVAAHAITPIQSAHNSCYAATNCTVTLGTPVVGDYVLVGIADRAPGATSLTLAVADTSSNSWTSNVQLETTSIMLTGIFCAHITAASGSFVITASQSSGSNSGWAVWAMEVSGLSSCTADQTGSHGTTSGSTTQSVTAAGANSNANDLVFSLVGLTYQNSATGLSNPPATGYTDIGNYDGGSSPYNSGADAGYKIVSAIETSSAGWTSTSSLNYSTVIATFEGAGASGGVGTTVYTNGLPFCQWSSVTANTNATNQLCAILCNATGGAVVITLPTAINYFGDITVVKSDSSGNACTMGATSAQTINGAAASSTTPATQWAGWTFRSDNANWEIRH